MISGRIAAVLSDVDGVLTDNRLLFQDTSQPAKTFHVLDGHATVLLREAGIYCALITGRADVAMQQRAEALKLPWYLARAPRDKGMIALELLAEAGIDPAHTVFVGDDVTDLPAFAVVGWPIAPADAQPAVRRAARRVTRAAGGHGVLREVVDWVLATRSR